MKQTIRKFLAFVMIFAMTCSLLPVTGVVTDTQVEAAGATVYYNFQPVTSFTNGQTYLFVPPGSNKSDMSKFCLTQLPSGSALLTATSTSNNCQDQYSDKNGKGTFKTYVDVTLSGTGFDGCNTGGLFQKSSNSMDYICRAGGSGICPGYTYSYSQIQLQSSMVSASINNGVAISNTGSTTLTKDDITIRITINGKIYNVEDYTFTDNKVDKTTGDNTLTVTFAGVSTNINVLFAPTANDFSLATDGYDTINIPGTHKNIPVSSDYSEAQIGKITTSYYDAEGSLLSEAPSAPGTYTVKISTSGGTLFSTVSDLELGTYTIQHVYNRENVTIVWSPDYQTAELSIPCAVAGCDHVEKLTVYSTLMPGYTATCLTKGTMTYQAQFDAMTNSVAATDWYPVSGNYTANAEQYTYTKELFGTKPHTMTYYPAKAATCTGTGHIAYYQCSECGYYYADEDGEQELLWKDIEIAKKDHDLEAVAYHPENCTDDGNEAHFRCTACAGYFVSTDDGYTEVSEADITIPKDGHNLIRHSATAATCTASGIREYWQCTECDKLFADVDGTDEITEDDLATPATGHTLTFHAYAAPTCTDNGMAAYYSCSVCGKKFKCSDARAADENTEETAGLKYSRSSLTNSQFKALTQSATGHSYTRRLDNTRTVVSAATCEQNEIVTYTYQCERCTATKKGSNEEVAGTALQHDFATPVCTWATDYSSCTAVFTCARLGCGKQIRLIAYTNRDNNREDGYASRITSTTTATCTKAGIRTYSTTFHPALAADATTYIAKDNQSDPAQGHVLVYHEGTDADCETAGEHAYWSCKNCDMHFQASGNHLDAANQAAEAQTLELSDADSAAYISDLASYLPIAATGHTYGAPVYTWSNDGKSVTITFTCDADASHVITIYGSTGYTDSETDASHVQIQAATKEAATCDKAGTTTYRIEGTYPADVYHGELTYLDTIDVQDLPASGHDYKLTNAESADDFDWSTDPVTGDVIATATFICQNNAAEKMNREVSVTSEVTTAPTCEEKGIRTYTGKVTFNGTVYTKTLNVDIAPMGHTYKTPAFAWDEDGKRASATFTCANDDTHTVTMDADITSKIVTPAACLTKGETEYSAAVTFDGQTYTDTETIADIAAAGHKFTYYAAKAATCTENGNIAYWYCNSCKQYYAQGGTSTNVQIADINADGVITKADTIVAATGHKLTYQPYVEATTESVGYYESWHCTICDKYFTDITAAKPLTNASGKVLKTNVIAKKKDTAAEKSKASIAKALGVDAETAAAIQSLKEQLQIADSTIKLTSATILKGTGIKGDTFSALRAKTTSYTNTSVTVSWTKKSGADGYMLYGNTCGKDKTYKLIKTFKGSKTLKYTQKKLKAGQYYKYMVVAYKEINGTKITLAASKTVHATTTGGSFGVAKSISVTQVGTVKNAKKIALSAGQTAQITAKEIAKDKPIKQHRKICYESSDKTIASVNSKGLITAKAAGTCKIYVYAQNGVYKTISVTVK